MALMALLQANVDDRDLLRHACLSQLKRGQFDADFLTSHPTRPDVELTLYDGEGHPDPNTTIRVVYRNSGGQFVMKIEPVGDFGGERFKDIFLIERSREFEDVQEKIIEARSRDSLTE